MVAEDKSKFIKIRDEKENQHCKLLLHLKLGHEPIQICCAWISIAFLDFLKSQNSRQERVGWMKIRCIVSLLGKAVSMCPGIEIFLTFLESKVPCFSGAAEN